MSPAKTKLTLATCCLILAAGVACDTATMSSLSGLQVPQAPAAPAAPAVPADPSGQQIAAPGPVFETSSVLGRVDPGFAFNVTLSVGGAPVINAVAVTLLPIDAALPGEPPRDAATETNDPQDGRVFYAVASTLAGNTQARVSIKSVPATAPLGLDDFIHGFSIFIRATSTASVTTRGDNPLFNIGGAAGDIVVTVTNVRMLNTAGAPFATVIAEAPREYFPPTLTAEQRPMVLFLRSGGIGQAAGGKFIHIAGVLPNVVDSTQTRVAADGGDALGTGLATAQVTGEFAAVSPAYVFAATPDDATANTGEFTWTMTQAAYDGTIDVDSGRVYADPAQAITVLPNPLIGTGDVYEIAVAAVMVTQ